MLTSVQLVNQCCHEKNCWHFLVFHLVRSVLLAANMQGGKNQKQDPAYGADVLRLWVASVDYTSDVLIGGRIISQVHTLSYPFACLDIRARILTAVLWLPLLMSPVTLPCCLRA